MESSDSLLKFIKSWEGCRMVAYNDAGGRSTIGVGHLIMPGEHFENFDEDAALHLLATDLRVAEDVITHHVIVPLTQYQFDALVSLCFNIGQGNFSNSSCLRHLDVNDYERAADDILNWNHVNHQVSDGLTHRRTAERELFLTGRYVLNT